MTSDDPQHPRDEQSRPSAKPSASSAAAEAYAATVSMSSESAGEPFSPSTDSPEQEAHGASEVVETQPDATDATAPDSQDSLEVAERERDEYLDSLRRLQADFENYRKRTLRQQTELVDRAAEDLISKLLPTLDAFDLARTHLGQGEVSSAEGRALLQASSLLADTLAKEGLDRIDDANTPFDPTAHEAVEHANAQDDAQEAVGGPVVDGVLRAGYRWKGRMLRPAMVRVRG